MRRRRWTMCAMTRHSSSHSSSRARAETRQFVRSNCRKVWFPNYKKATTLAHYISTIPFTTSISHHSRHRTRRQKQTIQANTPHSASHTRRLRKNDCAAKRINRHHAEVATESWHLQPKTRRRCCREQRSEPQRARDIRPDRRALCGGGGSVRRARDVRPHHSLCARRASPRVALIKPRAGP